MMELERASTLEQVAVLFVTDGSERADAVVQTLEERYSIDVSVVSRSNRSIDTRSVIEERYDCVVCHRSSGYDGGGSGTEIEASSLSLPVLVYAEPAADSEPTIEGLPSAVDDYLETHCDTEERTLLAHRISQLVTLDQRKPAVSRSSTENDRVDQVVLVVDERGQIVSANSGVERMGFAPRDLEGQPLGVLAGHVEDADRYRALQETLTMGSPWSGTIDLDRDGSSVSEVEVRVLPLADGDTTRNDRAEPPAEDPTEPGLEELRTRYRALINTAPDPIFVADAETGTILETNDAAAELLGKPKEDIIGSHQSTLHPTEDVDRYRALFERHLQAGQAIFSAFDDGNPLFVETADGERVPVEINARVVDLDDRTLIQGHFRDVSTSRERERTLRAILDRIPDTAIIYDEHAEYEAVLNTPDLETIDSLDPLEGKSVHDTLPSSVAERVEATVEETIATGESQRIEYRLPVDGERHWFEARTASLRTDAYRSDSVLFLARDITERKHRERELRTFRRAVEEAGHVIMITDADGRIEYVNPAFEAVTGYAEEEALGERPNLLQSGEHDEAFYDRIWQTILSGEVWEGELVNERKDGQRYHIEQTIAPIEDEGGTIERFVAINTDVTARRRYERQLERERDRLDEFASTVAHDLRNPLMIAMGNVDLAQEQTGDVESLGKAETALERMSSMIDELLTLSQQGKTVLDRESTEIAQLARRAWAPFSTTSNQFVVAPELEDISVRADVSRLRELFENLFRNAVEHGGEGVTVTLGSLEERPGVYVADDGPGIPPDDRDRVFENGYTTASEGTGFGLAIVEQIVEAHGWAIHVSRSDEGGARFDVVFDPPRSTEHDQPHSES